MISKRKEYESLENVILLNKIQNSKDSFVPIARNHVILQGII
jgi:hypothetical protein